VRFWLLVTLVLGCGWLGRIASSSVRERPRQLASLEWAVSRLETEINHTMVFLPEALETVAELAPAPVDRLFRDVVCMLLEGELPLKEAWCQAIVGAREYLVLSGDDERILINLGGSLGVSHRSDQSRHLAMARELLRQQESLARRLEQQSCRLYGALGWALGVALALMLA